MCLIYLHAKSVVIFKENYFANNLNSTANFIFSMVGNEVITGSICNGRCLNK